MSVSNTTRRQEINCHASAFYQPLTYAGWQGAGAYLSCHWVRGRVTQERSPVMNQQQTCNIKKKQPHTLNIHTYGQLRVTN